MCHVEDHRSEHISLCAPAHRNCIRDRLHRSTTHCRYGDLRY